MYKKNMAHIPPLFRSLLFVVYILIFMYSFISQPPFSRRSIPLPSPPPKTTVCSLVDDGKGREKKGNSPPSSRLSFCFSFSRLYSNKKDASA